MKRFFETAIWLSFYVEHLQVQFMAFMCAVSIHMIESVMSCDLNFMKGVDAIIHSPKENPLKHHFD